MGYTNYWYQHSNFTEKEWNLIKNEFKVLEFNSSILDITEEEDCILFNGLEENAHEDFVLYKKNSPLFNFCKTARKPYDIYMYGIY